MISRWFLPLLALAASSLQAAVEVSVQAGNGLAWIQYHCTAGEVVRAFALDVRVDQGQILGVSDFHVGESTADSPGYGIFPGSFRDHVVVGPGSSINWAPGDYSPIAPATDQGPGTLPGLGSDGVTLEMGGLWDPSTPEAAPGATGTLCALQISEGATVTVTANSSRGGVVAADPNLMLVPVFSGAFVQPPEITGLFELHEIFVITFEGGELEMANSLEGPWTTTGSTNGVYAEFMTRVSKRFFRVRNR
jgi:hypothetical protein